MVSLTDGFLIYNSRVRWKLFGVLIVAVSILAGRAAAGQDTHPVPFDEIIARFTADELAARLAEARYDFEVDVTVQEMNTTGGVAGEDHFLVTNDPSRNGKDQLKLIHPQPGTLRKVGISREDIEDILDVLTFAIRSDNLQKYDLQYTGDETVKNILCDVIDVKPRKLEKGQRYFQGKLWIAKSDLHVVKTQGRSVPDSPDNRSATFETYRAKVGDYWFPDTMQSRESLHFPSGSVEVRTVIVYGKFRARQ
jgi:hypothetical protein